MKNRVVITGMGAVSPNGFNLSDFENALKEGKSGVSYFPELRAMNFRCHLGAMPRLEKQLIEEFCLKYNLIKLRSTGILYGCMAGIEAWHDAGLSIIANDNDSPDWGSGCVFGTSANGMEAIEHGMKLVDKGEVRKLGGRSAQQAMNSGISAYLGGIIGLGNQVTTNSSACCTGTDSVLDAYYRVRWGQATRMLAGSSESSSMYIWGGYDRMPGPRGNYALASGKNDFPEKGSCPMSNQISGFVPGSGSGALVVESLDSALQRGARIYAEILGGASNSGGQTGKGSMVSPNPDSIQDCIRKALLASGVDASEIDMISGHLPSNENDIMEIRCWVEILKRQGDNFPMINSLKSMIGHCLSAAGSLELVALVLQLRSGFIHPSLNSEILHTEIAGLVSKSCIPQTMIEIPKLTIAAKLSYGVGDLNTCIILKKWYNS